MRKTEHLYRWGTILFVILALSYLWCIVENIITSAEMAKAGVVMPVTAVTITRGVSWLIAHGIHGVIIFALPAMLLWRTLPHNDVFSWEQELDVWLQNRTRANGEL